MACGSRTSSEENKNDGNFFSITPSTSIKKEKKIKMQSNVPKIHVVIYTNLSQGVESFSFWPCASRYIELSRLFTTTTTQLYSQVCLYINKHTHTHTFSQAFIRLDNMPQKHRQKMEEDEKKCSLSASLLLLLKIVFLENCLFVLSTCSSFARLIKKLKLLLGKAS